MLARCLSFALVLSACGERPEAVAVEPVDEPVVAEAPAEAEGVTMLPIDERTLPATAGRAALSYEVPRHPNAAARERLEGFLVALARDVQRRDYDDASCRLLLARPELVTVICRGRFDVRGGQALDVRPTHFAIAGDAVEPIAVADAFVDGADFEAEMSALCQAEGERREGGLDCFAAPPLTLGPRGIVGQLVVGSLDPEIVPLELDYATVRARVRPGGPLAAMLGVEGDAPPAGTSGAFVVSPTMLSDDLLAAYAALPRGADAGAAIRFQALGPSMARLVATSGGREIADRLAASFDTEARELERLDSASLSRLGWARATAPVRVHVQGRARAILPTGSVVLAVGELGDELPVAVRSALGVGSAEGTELEAHSGCVPAAPAGFGAGSPPLVAVTRAWVGRRQRDVVLFARSDADQTRIAIHDLVSSRCSVGLERSSLTVPGGLFHLQLQAANEHAGPTLVVVGTGGESDTAHYLVRELGAERDAWQRDIPTRVGVGYMVWLGFRWRRGGWMPVSYQDGAPSPFHGLRWADGTLEDVGSVDQ